MNNQQLQIQGPSTSMVTRTGGTFFGPIASEYRHRIGDDNLIVGLALDLLAAIAGVTVVSLLVFATNAAIAKDAPKQYTLADKAATCKAHYERLEVESVKIAVNGSVTFKYKGQAAMGPVPKKFAAQYALMKAGDIQCLPSSED